MSLHCRHGARRAFTDQRQTLLAPSAKRNVRCSRRVASKRVRAACTPPRSACETEVSCIWMTASNSLMCFSGVATSTRDSQWVNYVTASWVPSHVLGHTTHYDCSPFAESKISPPHTKEKKMISTRPPSRSERRQKTKKTNKQKNRHPVDRY